MEKIQLDSYKVRYISDSLKEKDFFIRKALDLTSISKLTISSQAKTIFEASREFMKADSIEKRKAALRKWIEISSSLGQASTVYDFIPQGDPYIDEKKLVIRKMAGFFLKQCGI